MMIEHTAQQGDKLEPQWHSRIPCEDENSAFFVEFPLDKFRQKFFGLSWAFHHSTFPL